MVVVNGLIVGWVLNVAYGAPLLLSMCTVALGQAVVCYVLGLPLLHLFRKRIPENIINKQERGAAKLLFSVVLRGKELYPVRRARRIEIIAYADGCKVRIQYVLRCPRSSSSPP